MFSSVLSCTNTFDDFAGSVICVELAQEAQPWLLGVVEPSGMYTVEVGFTSYMVQIMPGDEVIDVQMLEPITPGSCTFVKPLLSRLCGGCAQDRGGHDHQAQEQL